MSQGLSIQLAMISTDSRGPHGTKNQEKKIVSMLSLIAEIRFVSYRRLVQVIGARDTRATKPVS